MDAVYHLVIEAIPVTVVGAIQPGIWVMKALDDTTDHTRQRIAPPLDSLTVRNR
ncbi:MAG: hypothetical protein NPIRA06_32200 [Nitrospirales bacterium]|nr:MAG: hypothetical protein NPIRA06_32200 [Nitrospirales bacterium]